MKKTLIGIMLMWVLPSFAQTDNDYKDLLELMVDEQYERLVYKAERYTLSDKTKKDPLPYLYYAMAQFEMSKIQDFDENYPNAFKESLKFAAKYRAKDKQSLYYAEHQDFFAELRTATIAEADYYNMQEKYTKSKGYYKYLTKIDPNDAGAWMYLAYTTYMMKSSSETSVSLNEVQKLIDENGLSGMAEDQWNNFKQALMLYSETLDKNGENSEAAKWMNIGLPFFENDKEFMVTHNMIVG